MHKIFSHQYFVDDANIGDIIIALKHIEYVEVPHWQRTRQLMLSILSPYLKDKQTTAQDIWPLPTDHVHVPNHEISNADVEWYKQYVNNYKKQNTILE